MSNNNSAMVIVENIELIISIYGMVGRWPMQTQIILCHYSVKIRGKL